MDDLWDKIKGGGKITPEDISDTSDEGLVMITEALDIPGTDEGLESVSYSVTDDEEAGAL